MTIASLALLMPALARAQTTFGGTGSGAGELSQPAGVAVDWSSGDVYVADGGNQRVDVFAADGTFIKAFGWGVADGANRFETCTTTCQAGIAGSGAGQFQDFSTNVDKVSPLGVAIDQSSHDVYVVDFGNLRVQKFDSSGHFISMFGGLVDKTTGANVCTAASGDTCGAGTSGTGNGQFSWEPGHAAAGWPLTSYIAVGGSGTVYVGDNKRFQKFNSSGAYIGQIVTDRGGALHNVNVLGLAIGPSGNVYTTMHTYPQALYKWSSSGAILETLDVHGIPGALAIDTYGDLFVRDSAGGEHVLEYDPAGDQVNSFSLGSLSGSEGGIAYAQATRDLYVVDSAADEVHVVSTTPPPGPFIAPGSVQATGVAHTDAKLSAIINPEGDSMSYHFEYGLTSSYGHSTRAGTLSADRAFHTVRAYLSGLAPGTTYHFRVVAGSSTGPDQTFTTYSNPTSQSCPNARYRYGGGASLPDCRAYERITSAGAGNPGIGGPMTMGSLGGNAAAFSSFTPLPGSVSGPLDNAYGATRGARSWHTFPLNPPTGTQTGPILGTALVFGSTADFRKVLVATMYALTPGAISGQDVQNLYVHDTVDGSYRLVATSPKPFKSTGIAGKLTFDGAAPDGSRWVFGGRGGFLGFDLDSTPPPPRNARHNLYTWSPTEGLGLVGILPDGTVDPHGAAPAGAKSLAIAEHVVSADGSKIYWTEASLGSHPVYLRNGNDTTVVSHDVSGAAQPATFWYATPDGGHALISASVPLTADASATGTDLYDYDAASGKLTDLTPGSGDPGVIGAFGSSDDASYVYFLATGALAPGASAGEDNIYVRHNGHTRFIGALDAAHASEIAGAIDTGLGSMWRVSPDGQGFAFLFDGAISGPNPQSAQPYDEAYYYAYGNDSLNCASCLLNGTPSGPASFPNGNGGGQLFNGSYRGSALVATNNGRLFFMSPDALSPDDVNKDQDANHQNLDVYEYEREGAGSCTKARRRGGCVSLISSGDGPPGSIAALAGASRSGNDVFFVTTASLVAADRGNERKDLYDARVGGGLASQASQPEKSCTGDACKGAVAHHPSSTAPGSFRYSGPGNVHGGAHAAAVFHVRALSRRQRRRLATGRRIKLRVRVSKAGAVRVRVRGRLGRHHRVRTLAHGRHRARHGGTAKVGLRLSRRARRYLHRHRRLRVAVQVRYSHVSGVRKAHLVLRGARHPRRHRGHSRNGGQR